VTAVFAILILLIAAVPVLTILGGVTSVGFLLAIAAVAVASTVLSLPAGEFRRLGALWKPIAAIALIPCIAMLLQVVPVPGWFAHPVWMSASTALGEPLVGAITLDIGATLLGLGHYSLVLAIALIATAVCLDRRRAEILLFVLAAAATTIAAALIGLSLGSQRFAESLSAQRPQMLTITLIGLVLSCATTLRAFENYRWRRRGTNGSPDPSTSIAAAVPIAAMAICLSAIVIAADAAMAAAAASGVLVLIGLAVIHRLRLGPWGVSGIAAAAAVALIGFFAAIPTNGAPDLTLVVSGQPQVSIATAERILSDAKWAGTGAGTFAALLPIYRDVGDVALDAAPTAASSIAIEMGRPLLWLLVILALIGALSLLARALTRSREYVYAGTGAACIVAALGSSFANAGILGLGASLLTSAVCGLALAQSRSWSA
jgi:hypothetical protein